MMIVSGKQDLRLLCQIFDFSFFVGSVVESEFWIDRLKSRDNFKGRKKEAIFSPIDRPDVRGAKFVTRTLLNFGSIPKTLSLYIDP